MNPTVGIPNKSWAWLTETATKLRTLIEASHYTILGNTTEPFSKADVINAHNFFWRDLFSGNLHQTLTSLTETPVHQAQ